MESKPSLDLLYELYSGAKPLIPNQSSSSNMRRLTLTSGEKSNSAIGQTSSYKPLKLPPLRSPSAVDGEIVKQKVTVVANTRLEDTLSKKPLSDLRFSYSSVSTMTIEPNLTSLETQKLEKAVVEKAIEGISGFVHYPEAFSSGCGYNGQYRDMKHKQSDGIFFAGYNKSNYCLYYYDKQTSKLNSYFTLSKPHSMMIAAGHLIWGSNQARSVSTLKLDKINNLAEKNIRQSKFRLKHFVNLGTEVLSGQLFACETMLYFINNSLKTNLWQLVAHEIATGNEILHDHNLWGNKLASIYVLDRKLSILNYDGLVTVLKLDKKGKLALEPSLRKFKIKDTPPPAAKNELHRDRLANVPSAEASFTRILHTNDYIFVSEDTKVHVFDDVSDKPRHKINFSRGQSATAVCMKLLPQFSQKRTFLMLYDSAKFELYLILHKNTTRNNASWGGTITEPVASLKGVGMTIHDVGYYPSAKGQIAVWGLLNAYPPTQGGSCFLTFDLVYK